MKEGFMPMSQAHREGGAGLTPNSLNPYANNGEIPMPDIKNTESTPPQNSGILLPPGYGNAPEYRGLSNRAGTGPIHSGEGPLPHYEDQESDNDENWRSQNKILAAAHALNRLENPDGSMPTPERWNQYLSMARAHVDAPGFEYNPDEKKEIIARRDLSEDELPEELVSVGMLPREDAMRIFDEYIRNNPQTSPVDRELMREQAERGVNVSKGSSTELHKPGEGKLRRAGATPEDQAKIEARKVKEKKDGQEPKRRPAHWSKPRMEAFAGEATSR